MRTALMIASGVLIGVGGIGYFIVPKRYVMWCFGGLTIGCAGMALTAALIK